MGLAAWLILPGAGAEAAGGCLSLGFSGASFNVRAGLLKPDTFSQERARQTWAVHGSMQIRGDCYINSNKVLTAANDEQAGHRPG